MFAHPPTKRLAPIITLLALVACAGCDPTVKQVRAKNKASLDAAVAAFAAMEKAMADNPTPAPDAACARTGLVPVLPVTVTPVDLDTEAFRPTGDGNTEVLNGFDVVRSDTSTVSPLDDLLTHGLRGPLGTIVSELRYSQESTDMKVDAKRAQAPYDMAAKVKNVIVIRAGGPTGSSADRADVYLFEYPKASLTCAFGVDASAEQKISHDSGYDPRTGAPRPSNVMDRDPELLRRKVATELAARFGILYPPAKAPAIIIDDPAVLARARVVSKALDANAQAPGAWPPKKSKLPDCAPGRSKSGMRISKKNLRIMAADPLLDKYDGNVDVAPDGTAASERYVTTRDKDSARALATASEWQIVEIESGSAAANSGSDSYVGGKVDGRLVVFDAKNVAVCQKRFHAETSDTMKVMQDTRTGSSDIGARSAADLRKRISDLLDAD